MFSQTQSLISRCRAWAASLICAVTLGIGNPGLGSPAPLSIRVWQTEDGLPQNSVTCLLQSRQGYLWFGTYAGLTRFDGATFTVYDSERFPGLADNRITALCEDEQGNLWIGHETGSITRFGQNGMETIELPDRAQRSEILGMAASSAGSVWVLNRGGWLVQLPQETVIEPPAVAGPMANSHGIVAENDGSVWCLRRGRLEQILADGPTLWKAPGAASPVAAQAITPAWAGGIWISIEGRVRRMHRDAWQEDPPEQPWADKAIANLEELADGGILVGTRESGLYLCDAAGRVRHFSTTNGLSQSWVRSMLQDREGTLWVGLGNGGLNAIRSVHFEGVNPPDHWGGRSVLSVTAAQDGGVWVGTEGAGLYRWRDEAWSHYAEPQGLLNRYVWSVAETRKGELLVGTWSGGLFVWDQGGLRVAPGTEGMTRPVTALMPGTGNEMWIGTRDGVGRYEAGHLTWLSPPAGTRLAEVRCLARGPDDSLWIGMNGLGLARYRPGEFQLFDEADGLGSDFISCLHFDARGDLWIGTAGGGLARYKEGRFSRIGSRQGLPSVNISTMREDGQGGVWLGSSAGVLQVRKDALDACADGTTSNLAVTVYGVGDGLETTECSGGFQPASCRTPDGYIWFPTRKGLVRVNPAALTPNILPPPVLIERFRCEGEDIPLPSDGAQELLHIPPGRERFEFRFTALSLVAPEKVRFKYRLTGLEPNWVEQRERSASYSYLQPGDYVFEVVACNNDGLWNETGARLAFTVLPFFWQTLWFRVTAYVASCLAVAGVVYQAARRRARRKLEAIERQQAVERERARIAKDIHDDLGASLTRITMLSQMAQKQLEHPVDVGTQLERIDNTARQLTRAMDEIVWAVNPRHDTLDSLAIYIVRFAQDFLSPAGIRCRVDMPMAMPQWPIGAELRHNVFLAYKEAINNVVRHAQAQEVKLSLHPRLSGFELTVEDDGAGFDQASVAKPGERNAALPRTGGNGLRNMRTRMSEIGGSVDIQSAVGGGTRITFHARVASRAQP